MFFLVFMVFSALSVQADVSEEPFSDIIPPFPLPAGETLEKPSNTVTIVDWVTFSPERPPRSGYDSNSGVSARTDFIA